MTMEQSSIETSYTDRVRRWTAAWGVYDSMLADYLEGKTVAIVGHTKLDEMEQGELIDSHDVVVRLHDSVPHASHSPVKRTVYRIPEHRYKFVGTRTNIFYVDSLSEDTNELDKMVSALKRDGGKYICCEPWVDMWLTGFINSRIRARIIDIDFYRHVHTNLGSPPLSGTLIISDILRHTVKKLYLTGFHCRISPDGKLKNSDVQHKPWNDFNYLKRLSKLDYVDIDPLMQGQFDKHGV